jgi:hypothetical protein
MKMRADGLHIHTGDRAMKPLAMAVSGVGRGLRVRGEDGEMKAV